jgi:hypothetical protein
LQVKTKKEEELDIFDESDWSFISAGTSNDFEMYEYFAEIKDLNLESSGVFDNIGKILNIVLCVMVGVLIVMVAGAYISTTKKTEAVQEATSLSTVEEDTDTTLEYVEGEDVSGDELKGITNTISDYFGVLHDGSDLSALNDYCASGSTVAETEESYRTATQYSYDFNDCYSRAMRGFGQCITLQRVDKVVKSDGQYYCYVTLSVPYYQGFSDYYRVYQSDMRQFFLSEQINSIGVMKYILRVLEFGDMPALQTQYLVKVDANGKITEDMFVQNILLNSYTKSVENITSKLGTTIDIQK